MDRPLVLDMDAAIFIGEILRNYTRTEWLSNLSVWQELFAPVVWAYIMIIYTFD